MTETKYPHEALLEWADENPNEVIAAMVLVLGLVTAFDVMLILIF